MKRSLKIITALVLGIVSPQVLWAQFTLTGTVTGTGNNPLSGASVKLKNNNNVGVITDASGKFSLGLQKWCY